MTTEYSQSNFTDAELDHIRQQGEAERQRNIGFRPAPVVSTREEITFRGGQIVEETFVNKSAGERTAYATPAKPGMVNIGGIETSVSAAKAAGLLPANWSEGQPLPFERGASREAPYIATKGLQAITTPPSTGRGPQEAAESHSAHLTKVAGEILRGVDEAHGSDVSDGLLREVAENGEPESILTSLPPGVTETHVKQVMAGFISQANNCLASVGSSVTMLQEVMDDHDLRRARLATLQGDDAALHQIGEKAVNTLAQLPERDPVGFMEMVSGMNKAERDCIRFDKNSRQWRVTVPGQPEMSYGAAVRLGLVRV